MVKVKSQKSKVKTTSKKSKFHLLTLTFTFLLLLFNFPCFAQDKIIAVVNNEVITQKDYDDFINFMRMQLSRELEGKALEDKINSMKADLLDKLIEDRLILQEAKKTLEGANKNKDLYTASFLQVDENRVKARINEIKKKYPSEIVFQEDIKKQGLVQADLEAKIREQFLMYNIIDIKVRSKIQVRPEEVTNFYNESKNEFINPEIRELDAITLENKDQAKSFSFELQSGAKLEDLAVRFPITVNKLEVSQQDDLKKEIQNVVFKLGIGEASGPVNIDNQFYVFKLNNIIPPQQLTLSQAQDKISSYLLEKKMQEALAKWLDELRAKAYIKISKEKPTN